MAIVYKNAGPWGAGSGRLTSAEADNNFWELVQLYEGLIASPVQPNEIVDITVEDNQMTVVMDDSTEFGPFDLPIAEIKYIGAWPALTPIKRGNLFRANDAIWYTNVDHTTAASFDPDAGILGPTPYYSFLFYAPSVFSLAWFAPGTPGLGIPPAEPMFAYVVNRQATVPANLAGAYVRLMCSSVESDLVFNLYAQDEFLGTITIGAGLVVNNVPASVVIDTDGATLAPGEILWLSPPELESESGSEITNAKNLAMNITLEFADPDSESSESSSS